MSSWTFAYHQVNPGVTVNYNSIGSGGGIAQITAKTVDIGASDAPLSASQYSGLPATVVTIPESISGVVPAYNLPGIKNGLNFTGDVLARIFLGTITTWNDPALVALNPGVTLPSNAITVVHRSDGSGTMYAFTNYLTDSNAQWKSQVSYSITPTGPLELDVRVMKVWLVASKYAILHRPTRNSIRDRESQSDLVWSGQERCGQLYPRKRD